MLSSQLAPARGYPRVQEFVVQVLDMQFGDVRAMLQLPQPLCHRAYHILFVDKE